MANDFKLQEKIPDFVKEIWTGTIDAISKTEEDVKGFINKMVERGRLTPEEGKKLVNDLLSKISENREKVEKRASERIEKTLHLINLPSKNEVEKLSKKVTSLTRRVNKLKKEIAA